MHEAQQRGADATGGAASADDPNLEVSEAPQGRPPTPRRAWQGAGDDAGPGTTHDDAMAQLKHGDSLPDEPYLVPGKNVYL